MSYNILHLFGCCWSDGVWCVLSVWQPTGNQVNPLCNKYVIWLVYGMCLSVFNFNDWWILWMSWELINQWLNEPIGTLKGIKALNYYCGVFSFVRLGRCLTIIRNLQEFYGLPFGPVNVIYTVNSDNCWPVFTLNIIHSILFCSINICMYGTTRSKDYSEVPPVR